jgi:hypothetical protein
MYLCLGISLFIAVFRTALGPTQPPFQWLSGALSLGVKRLVRGADHSPPSSAEVKNAWSYTSIPPTRLHGVVLSQAHGRLYLFYVFMYTYAWSHAYVCFLHLQT